MKTLMQSHCKVSRSMQLTTLTCLESGVAHILSVAVGDRFGILVADQGQMDHKA